MITYGTALTAIKFMSCQDLIFSDGVCLNMSTVDVKASLIDVLTNSQETKVIVLSGAWGTGKTYLWRKVEGVESVGLLKPIYLSLFGAKSIDELKVKILENAVVKNANYQPSKQYLKLGIGFAQDVAKKYLPGASMERIAFLGMSSLIKGRLIVIDDIERKHHGLSVQEIMGFVNESVDQYGCRFVMLLNAAKLNGIEDWEEFHEKIVDREFKVSLLPDEAVTIAAGGRQIPYIEKVKGECVRLGLTNIRIIKRALSVSSELFDGHQYDGRIIDRLVPTVVFMTAINYRALPDLPTMAFLTTVDSITWSGMRELNDQQSGWLDLVRGGGYANQKFVALLNSYFERGYFSRDDVTAIFSEEVSQRDRIAFAMEVAEFQDQWLWSKDFDISALDERFERYRDAIPCLFSHEVTELASVFREAGREDLEVHTIDLWIGHIEPKITSVQDSHRSTMRREHPRITEMYDRVGGHLSPAWPLDEAIWRAKRGEGWGGPETQILREVSPEEFVSTIEKLDGQKLGEFIHGMFSFNRIVNIEETYPGMMGAFYSGCRMIMNSSANHRLKSMIAREFSRYGKQSELERPVAI